MIIKYLEHEFKFENDDDIALLKLNTRSKCDWGYSLAKFTGGNR